jgi:predicted ester cyclase
MSVDENKDIVRRFYEGYRAGNIDNIFELVDKAAIHHGLSGRGFTSETWRQAENDLFAGFPDMLSHIEFQVAEADRVATCWSLTGFHQGTFLGLQPTGRQVTLTVISIDRVSHGKIVEHWVEADLMGFMGQLN